MSVQLGYLYLCLLFFCFVILWSVSRNNPGNWIFYSLWCENYCQYWQLI